MTQRRTLMMALGITALGLAATAGRAAAAGPLSAYRWKSRLLLVFAPSGDDASLQRQRRELIRNESGGAERDLAIIEVIGDRATASRGTAPDAAALRDAYRVPVEKFAMILIGKDGGEKLRQSSPIEASRLFAAIDRMPMRRDEARGQ